MRRAMALFFVFAFFIVSAVLPLPVEGADGALLEGLVRTTAGKSASGVRVTIWDGRTRYTAVTDGEGRFSVQGIPPGVVFALRLSPAAFSSVRVDGFRFPERGNLYISMEFGGVNRGERYTAGIPSNPSTGYSWSLLDPGDERVVRFREASTEQLPETPGGAVGRGVRELWTFDAAGRGRSSVVLGYRRPWESAVSPLRYHVIALIVR